MSDDRPTITQQYAFSVGKDGEIDGDIKPSEESVETSLETFGATVDHRERDTRMAQPEATTFGVDDRPEVTRTHAGEQGALFADTDDDQQTLTGERAASQCLFGDDTTDEDARPHDEPTDTDDDRAEADDEPTRAPQAVATDGGRDEHNNDQPACDSCGETPPYAGQRALHDVTNGSVDADALCTTCILEDADGLFADVRDDNDDTHPNTPPKDDEDGENSDENKGEPEPDEDDEHDPTFDPDEKTVTDAWEGAFLSTSWGYGQTNVELAQIVEVSDTGKTVLARRVGAERVGHGRTSVQLRPTADQFGDEFRLHVRSSRGDPAFRGTYPLSGGDMDDSPTRRGWFYPFDNDPEHSIRKTATNYGH